MSLFDNLNDKVGHAFSAEAIESLKDIVNRFPVTVPQVAGAFTDDEVKRIGDAIKVVNDDTATVKQKEKAFAVIGKLISLVPLG